MIVKVLDDKGAGTTGGVAEGIRYAAANGARVINLSLGGHDATRASPRRSRPPHAANALVVASAGNDGRDIDSKPAYPAAIPAANLLAVASTDPDSGRGISRVLQLRAARRAGRRARRRDPLHRHRRRLRAQERHLDGRPDGRRRRRAGRERQPAISAADLRALIMQNATRSQLPVAAGYVDALHTVLAASLAAGHDTTQPPRLRILDATRKGRRTRIQAAALGSTAAIRRYRVRLGKRVVASSPPAAPFKVTIRRRGARVRVDALDAAGAVASAQRKVTQAAQGQARRRQGRRHPRHEARAALLVAAAASPLSVQRRARRRARSRMSGEQITRALVADLAYFYRHAHAASAALRAHRRRHRRRVSPTPPADHRRRAGLAGAGRRRPARPAVDTAGLSGVCLVTNTPTRCPAISRAQLQDIVAGRATPWKQIPGRPHRRDHPGRPGPGQRLGTCLPRCLPRRRHPARLAAGHAAASQQARDFIERNPAAFGYLDLALTGTLHAIPYEGVACTRATVRDGRYPARRPLGIVTRGRPSGALRQFLRWVRTSRTARRVIATRYIPA